MKILGILTEKRITGNIGEDSAVKYLKQSGYKILERGYVAKGHEIDIIAERDGVVAFIEVKARTVGRENPKEPRPASAVNRKKQQSIIAAASYYKLRKAKDKRARFDVIEVYLEDTEVGKVQKEIKHLIGAFDLNTSKYRKANYK